MGIFFSLVPVENVQAMITFEVLSCVDMVRGYETSCMISVENKPLSSDYQTAQHHFIFQQVWMFSKLYNETEKFRTNDILRAAMSGKF